MTARGSTVARVLVAAVLVLAGVVATSPASTAAASGSSGSSDWTAISAGAYHTCGIRDGGHLFCWGANASGELGDGTTTDRTSPVENVGGHADWTTVSSGNQFTCGRRASGRLYCWGMNTAGQLGDGTTNNRVVPTQVAGGRTDWTTISAGDTHTCALRTSRRLYCWGDNGDGRLGDGTTTDHSAPTPVVGTVSDWTTVAAGGGHTCGLRATGRLLCWGYNASGQLGDGSTGSRTTPASVSGATTGYTTVAAANAHTCARQSSGRLSCWGSNYFGQLGDATRTDRAVPTAVARGATDWKRLELGLGHSCALTGTGRAYCWGYNEFGQLGDGTTIDRFAPTKVVVR